jgi:NAD(P)-dependent dehydrogenase (short-subunit alcohol dehydrogenase family)
MMERAIFSHIITAHFAAPLMIETGGGLIVEITDGNSFGYRGNIFYDLVKTSVIRLAFAYSYELRKRNITSLAVTPGFLRSEAMLDHFGVTEENWQDAAKKDPNFISSETPCYVGRAVAALAADPNLSAKNGRVLTSGGLAREYGFTDIDGRRPDWEGYFEEKYGASVKACDDDFYGYWFGGAMEIVFPDWP